MHPLTPNRALQLPIREDGVYRTVTNERNAFRLDTSLVDCDTVPNT